MQNPHRFGVHTTDNYFGICTKYFPKNLKKLKLRDETLPKDTNLRYEAYHCVGEIPTIDEIRIFISKISELNSKLQIKYFCFGGVVGLQIGDHYAESTVVSKILFTNEEPKTHCMLVAYVVTKLDALTQP